MVVQILSIMVRALKGCVAPALYHILACKFICNNNIWYGRNAKGVFGTLILSYNSVFDKSSESFPSLQNSKK